MIHGRELRPTPIEKWFVENKSDKMKHQTEWCAEATRYRCMTCARGSKYMNMPGKCKSLAKMVKTTVGRP